MLSTMIWYNIKIAKGYRLYFDKIFEQIWVDDIWEYLMFLPFCIYQRTSASQVASAPPSYIPNALPEKKQKKKQIQTQIARKQKNKYKYNPNP